MTKISPTGPAAPGAPPSPPSSRRATRVEAGRITSIWRYPVKSMAGERLAAADLGTSGLHADRTWAVRDLELDATTSAKRLPGLLQCTARYVQAPPPDAGPGNAPEVIVGLPGGQNFSSSDPAVHQALSDYLDPDVRLTPLPPVHARERPEWQWCGGVLRAPHADIAPMIPTIRCLMPSHAQPGLDCDPEITRVLAARSRRCLGVYATVARTGRIAEGDVLQLDSPSQSAVASAAGSGAAKLKRTVLGVVSAGIPKGR